MPREADPDLEEFVDEPVPPVAPGAKRGLTASAAVPSSRPGGTSTWVIVLAVVGVVALIVVPVIASVAIYGVRRYLVLAKAGEGRADVQVFAKGLVSCASETGKLPETSPRVPQDLALISGQKFQSAPDDWADEAFRCARFRLTQPQYFQYQWVLGDDGEAGSVVAVADLDGSGDAEIRFELDVDCSGDSCTAANAIRESGL